LRPTAAAFVLAAASTGAQAPSDFSGTWKLRQPESSGSSRVETIEQRGASLKVVVESSFTAGSMGGGFHLDHTYVVGGPAEVSRSEDEAIADAIQRYADGVERFAREHPGQYFEIRTTTGGVCPADTTGANNFFSMQVIE
jgi:hypothetical protein